MNSRFLLDTNTVSYYLKNRSQELNSRIDSVGLRNFCWSSVVCFELYYGAYRELRKNPGNQWMNRALKVMDCLFGMVEVVPLTLQDSKLAAQMLQIAESKGLSKGTADMLIAAQAINNECTLVSNDTSAFEGFDYPGLKWSNWTA